MLKGKVGVVFGFASKKSIAWSIASSWQQAGAKVFIGLQSSRFQENLNNLTGAWPEKPQTFLCDVAKDEEIAAAFQFMKNEAPRVDMLAHSIAYATAHAMKSSFLETTREDYRVAHEISAYSLIALSAGVAPLMDPVEGGSIVSLSYLGSQRVVPSYKVMGTAKAALETTTKYLAAELVRMEGGRWGALAVCDGEQQESFASPCPCLSSFLLSAPYPSHLAGP